MTELRRKRTELKEIMISIKKDSINKKTRIKKYAQVLEKKISTRKENYNTKKKKGKTQKENK